VLLPQPAAPGLAAAAAATGEPGAGGGSVTQLPTLAAVTARAPAVAVPLAGGRAVGAVRPAAPARPGPDPDGDSRRRLLPRGIKRPWTS
jgi:hypothetical protein